MSTQKVTIYWRGIFAVIGTVVVFMALTPSHGFTTFFVGMGLYYVFTLFYDIAKALIQPRKG